MKIDQTAKVQILQVAVATAVFLLLGACSKEKSHIEEIADRGQLRVATRLSPTTYYIDKDGETGLEYELVKKYTESLGVDFELTVVDNYSDLTRLVITGKVDLAAAGIIRSYTNDESLVFGPGYHWVTKQVIYRNGFRKPKSLDDLYPHKLHVPYGMLQSSVLEEYKRQHPSLEWEIHRDKDVDVLLTMIEHGDILYTVAYSNELAHSRLVNPEVRAAFDISVSQPLSWLIRVQNHDYSLLKSVRNFHETINDNGELADLIQRFYGPLEFFDYVDSRKFIDRYASRLAEFRPFFIKAAEEFDYDWRLLAAISYQESHWDKTARSATGVRGLMMLTQRTAKQVGVTNRLDPEQSIWGGAKYLTSLSAKLPERIREPDKTWLTLAAYNVGFGHLEDARIITQRDGDDPDSWEAVKTRLPLLSKKKWYSQTKYGYARGYEPVRFVENIQKYYNVLLQLTQDTNEPQTEETDYVLIDSMAL